MGSHSCHFHLGVLMWLHVHGVSATLPHLLLVLRLLLLLHMRAPHPCMLQSIRGRTRAGYRVPREGGVPKVGFPVAPGLRGGGRGKFSAGRQCTGAGCRFTSRKATRHRYQAGQGKCGHTFPPPGGSWCPIRVTWTWVGHQAINVCGTTRSGIWVLKGNARTRMLPDNLDHLRVEWRP